LEWVHHIYANTIQLIKNPDPLEEIRI